MVVMALQVVEMLSFGGCRYWGERDGVMSGMSSCFLDFRMMVRIWDGGNLSVKTGGSAVKNL